MIENRRQHTLLRNPLHNNMKMVLGLWYLLYKYEMLNFRGFKNKAENATNSNLSILKRQTETLFITRLV
jgi:hypothetical protein